MMAKKASQAEIDAEQEKCRQWNIFQKIGTPIRVSRLGDLERVHPRYGRIRKPAQVIGSATPHSVVWLTGWYGYVFLEDCDVLTEEEFAGKPAGPDREAV